VGHQRSVGLRVHKHRIQQVGAVPASLRLRANVLLQPCLAVEAQHQLVGADGKDASGALVREAQDRSPRRFLFLLAVAGDAPLAAREPVPGRSGQDGREPTPGTTGRFEDPFPPGRAR